MIDCRLDVPDPYSVEQANDLQILPSEGSTATRKIEMIITRKGATKRQQAVSWMALASHDLREVRLAV